MRRQILRYSSLCLQATRSTEVNIFIQINQTALLVCGELHSRAQVGLTPKIFLFCSVFFFFLNRTFGLLLLGNTDVQG